MNSRDRDEFYLSKPAAGNDDGDDYELEPPDAGVLAAEEQRGRQAIEASRSAIDIDEIYRDAGRQRSEEILENWFKDFKLLQFRFKTKHLLIAAAALAVILTLWRLDLLGTAIVLLMMISVFGLYTYFSWQEQKADEEASRRREEMYARRRAQQQRMSGGDETA
jgi:hypothetical protein